MSDLDIIEQKFDKLKPWITQFTINGRKYGGNVSFDEDIRIRLFFECFPDMHSILELGSLEGGHTFQLGKNPEITVLGIEGREYNITKANFIKELLNIPNVSFVCADLESSHLSDFGKYDAVFCSGLLYHLPRPWDIIQEISKVTSKVFLWTHYASDTKAEETINGYRGFWYEEFGFNDPLSGLSKKSYWVTKFSLFDMLKKSGFSNVKVFADDQNHPHGPAITLGAWK
jgi:SAM-dependent methyltransferase